MRITWDGRHRAARILQLTIAPALLAFAWQGLSQSRLGDPLYTPSLAEIGVAFYEMAASGELLTHLAASGQRLAGGFFVAAALAVPAGIVTAWYRWPRVYAAPVFEMLRPFPSITLMPIAILWFGIGEASRIFLTAYACFWPMFLNAMTGVREISPAVINAARVMEIDGARLVARVIVPAALPTILAGVRQSLAVSIIVLIIAEMVGATSGIGYLILDAERSFLTARMLAGIAVMGAVGMALNSVALLVERRLLPYRPEAQ